MKHVFKWGCITLVGLIILVVVLVGGLHLMGQSRLNNAPEIATSSVTAATGEEAVARGRQLANISSCTGCHASNLAGTVFVDEPPIGYISAPNLTTGDGGVGAAYSDADWEKAIRHGVAKDGRVLATMPSNHFASYGDDDLANLIAYLKSVPPADNRLGERQIQFPGTIIFGVLAYGDWAVNQIDHSSVGGNAPPAEASAEYGAYLVDIASCASCHAENLAGNTDPNGPPLGPNITPGGNPGDWDLAAFRLAIQAGQTPDGRILSDEMPWPQYAVMSDTETEALWLYLQGLDPLPDNQP